MKLYRSRDKNYWYGYIIVDSKQYKGCVLHEFIRHSLYSFWLGKIWYPFTSFIKAIIFYNRIKFIINRFITVNKYIKYLESIGDFDVINQMAIERNKTIKNKRYNKKHARYFMRKYGINYLGSAINKI